MIVLELPPRLSFNNQVNLESRYGTNLARVANALITSPSAERDELMPMASFFLSPCACVFANLSDPAKSTNEIRDTRSPTDLVAASLNLSVRTMVKTACDRLLPS